MLYHFETDFSYLFSYALHPFHTTIHRRNDTSLSVIINKLFWVIDLRIINLRLSNDCHGFFINRAFDLDLIFEFLSQHSRADGLILSRFNEFFLYDHSRKQLKPNLITWDLKVGWLPTQFFRLISPLPIKWVSSCITQVVCVCIGIASSDGFDFRCTNNRFDLLTIFERLLSSHWTVCSSQIVFEAKSRSN